MSPLEIKCPFCNKLTDEDNNHTVKITVGESYAKLKCFKYNNTHYLKNPFNFK
jgi:hypothetical protein